MQSETVSGAFGRKVRTALLRMGLAGTLTEEQRSVTVEIPELGTIIFNQKMSGWTVQKMLGDPRLKDIARNIISCQVS